MGCGWQRPQGVPRDGPILLLLVVPRTGGLGELCAPAAAAHIWLCSAQGLQLHPGVLLTPQLGGTWGWRVAEGAGGSLPTHPEPCWELWDLPRGAMAQEVPARLAGGQSPAERWQSSHGLGWGQEIVPGLHSPRALKGENGEGEERRRQRMQ